jgi:ATP-dependent Lon protease
MIAFPNMVVPVKPSLSNPSKSAERALAERTPVVLLACRANAEKDPSEEDLYRIGVTAVSKPLELNPNRGIILLDTLEIVKVRAFDESRADPCAFVEKLHFARTNENSPEIVALHRALIDKFKLYIRAGANVATNMGDSLEKFDDVQIAIAVITMAIPGHVDTKQAILEETVLSTKIKKLILFLESEIEGLKLDRKISAEVASEFHRSHRDAYLHETMRAIQKELGDDDEAEIENLAKKIDGKPMPKEAKARAKAELGKLKKMHPQSAEAGVCRNYIESILELPWDKKSPLVTDLKKAAETLDRGHYALDKIKDRILEFLAVQKRSSKPKGTILCFAGPPGVGKTSLGRAIAEATGRSFAKLSLGGVHDEAEIRGHRRTYVGATTGKILATMKKAGTSNPLIILDEIDKLGSDTYHGDPQSAMLEVLDPEQNTAFNDHYIDLDYDLSHAMFIATANSLDGVQRPLLDRMEVIELSGYTEAEKIEIARRHIIPKLLERNGLKDDEFSIDDSALGTLIQKYTRESGVRGMERQLDKIMRKVVRKIAEAEASASPSIAAASATDASDTDADAAAAEAGAGAGSGASSGKTQAPAKQRPITEKITAENLKDSAGVEKFNHEVAFDKDAIGIVRGLAWTEAGGEMLTIEAAIMEGKGEARFTGKLGDVMKESIETAKSFIRSRSRAFGIDPRTWAKTDIHIHVPEGATPKDGPSAGVAMTTAIVSAMTGIPVRACVAMTGEATLRGRILPIGGLKEKLLAAARGGIKTVLIPFENKKDLDDIPKAILSKISVMPVKTADEALKIALGGNLSPLAETGDFYQNLLAEAGAPRTAL